MLNFIWAGLMLISVICGFAGGRSADVSAAVFSGAGSSVELCISLLGCICLFSGIMEIAQKSGLSSLVALAMSPIMRLIFPGLRRKDKAFEYISLNITANILGLSNAATPFGLKAMSELDKMNSRAACASDYMVTFIVMNTASVQLIPTTVAMLRQKAGAAKPLDIMPCVWCAGAAALIVGIVVANAGNKLSNRRLKERKRRAFSQ